MPMFGPWELVILLIIVVVIFGAGRLSQIGGALGKSIREFRSATQEELPPAKTPAVTPAPAAVVAATKSCPACGHANPADQRFCSECGAKLAEVPAPAAPAAAEVTCPSCATHNPAGQTFCGQCGTRLTPTVSAA
jgi:sec-independent protein translocase protein TatA